MASNPLVLLIYLGLSHFCCVEKFANACPKKKSLVSHTGNRTCWIVFLVLAVFRIRINRNWFDNRSNPCQITNPIFVLNISQNVGWRCRSTHVDTAAWFVASRSHRKQLDTFIGRSQWRTKATASTTASRYNKWPQKLCPYSNETETRWYHVSTAFSYGCLLMKCCSRIFRLAFCFHFKSAVESLTKPLNLTKYRKSRMIHTPSVDGVR